MASSIQTIRINEIAQPVRPLTAARRQEDIYRQNSHRIYSLAFWMTGSELEAERMVADVFREAFQRFDQPQPGMIDCVLVSCLRERMPIGLRSLDCSPSPHVLSVRLNVKRVHLEQAVIQVPATERLVFLLHDVERYSHPRIAATLGIAEKDSRVALHQARLRIRELLHSFQ